MASATTNGRGIYRFSGLESSNYTIEVPLPPSSYFRPADAGDDALDSDVDIFTGHTALISYVGSFVHRTWDVGLIGQFPVFEDGFESRDTSNWFMTVR